MMLRLASLNGTSGLAAALLHQMPTIQASQTAPIALDYACSFLDRLGGEFLTLS